MRQLILTTRFRRDLRRAARRGKDPARLGSIIERLVAGEPLESHQLAGNLAPLWECPIENDWLLVWDEDAATVTLIRPEAEPANRPAPGRPPLVTPDYTGLG